jgi:molybdopterin-guanine dinucleotide biosynthesis protein A
MAEEMEGATNVIPMPEGSSIAGFVLVGGRSSRMGRDKALLELAGKPLHLRAADLLKRHVAQVSLIGPRARYSHFGLPVLEDAYADRGPLAALYTGLSNSSCDWNVFLACDLPFIGERLIDMLLKRISTTTAQAVVPKTSTGWQPLCAAYHAGCLPYIERAIERGEWAIVDLLPLIQVEPLTGDSSEDPKTWEQMFYNVNTADDWERAQSLLDP